MDISMGQKKEYPSMMEASRQLGIRFTSIESALRTGDKAKGYRFYYSDVGPMPKEKKKRPSRTVLGLDKDGNLIKIWESAKEAALDLHVIRAAIYGCFNSDNPNATCKGYRLKYKDS